MPQTSIDFEMTAGGDFIVDNTGDLKLADPEQTAIQDIEFRLRTAHWDYGPDPLIGAGLEAQIGKPSNDIVSQSIHDSAIYALTHDGRFRATEIAIDVIYLDHGYYMIFVFITDYIEGTGVTDEALPEHTVASFTISTDTGDITRITGVEE
jgi:hypothetical protein